MGILRKSILTMSMIMFTFVVMAQSIEEVGAKYNEGNGLYKEKDYTNAISAYELGIELANEVGFEADDLKGTMQTQLMNAYYKNGIQYKTLGLGAAIASLEKAYALAGKLNDDSMKSKSASTISKLRSAKGNSFLKKGKLEEAFAEYEMAIDINPNCVKGFYGKGLVYKSKGDYKNMMINMDKVIEIGADNPKAAKTVKKAKSTTSKTLVNAGAKEIQIEHGKKAAEYINMSFNYAPGNANAYYYLTLAYNNTNSWDEAIASANKAIGLETGDKGDMYFALGQAYEGKGDVAGACTAYKSVTTGPNVESAKYQITQVLKCK